MNALTNARNKSKEKAILIEKFDNDLIGVDRLLSHLEKWEKQYDIRSMKTELDEFVFGLESERGKIITQLKKLRT